jgi:hypothetical protein
MSTIAPASTMQQFYAARAAEATRDAKAATLVNVRDRHLASATTWTSLAARARRVDKRHAGLIADKAAARAAATALKAA